MRITLQEARKRAGITQTELAKRTGIPQPTMSAYEANKSLPDNIFHCFKIEEELNALGQIKWDSVPEDIVRWTVKAIANLSSQYPFESILIGIVRLIRTGGRYPDEVVKVLKAWAGEAGEEDQIKEAE